MDSASAKEILALGRLTDDAACGATPINGLLLAAKRRGMRAELIDLRNSGDTAGDKHRVVGYGAFAFYEQEKA
jgi:AmmeMemoRadiSam system protein B